MESAYTPEPGKITKPAVHTFDSSHDAYDWLNVGEHPDTNEPIRDGDVLSVPSESLVGIGVEAWPVRAFGENRGAFHELDQAADWTSFEDGRYEASFLLARVVALPTDVLVKDSAAAATSPFIVEAYRRVSAAADDHRYAIVGRFRHDGYRSRSAIVNVLTGEFGSVQDISSAYLQHGDGAPFLRPEKIGEELERRKHLAAAADGPVELEAYIRSGGALCRDDSRLF